MANPVIDLDIPNPRIAQIEKGGLITRPLHKFFLDLVRRLGGERADFIQEARGVALANEAMILAILRGITTGYYHTPTNPLSFSATSATLATISVAQHTRSTAAATIQAGTVTNVTRGLTYYVYYDDAGDAGGAVTFAATTNVSILTAAGRRLVGAIYVEPQPPSGGTAN